MATLVGRSAELARLRALLDDATSGAVAALIGGDAGVGKSRLVSEFGQAATGAGARVLTGGCLELGTDGLPFAPFTAVLRDLVHELGADAVAAMLPGRTTRGLARLLPELGEPDVAEAAAGRDAGSCGSCRSGSRPRPCCSSSMQGPAGRRPGTSATPASSAR